MVIINKYDHFLKSYRYSSLDAYVGAETLI